MSDFKVTRERLCRGCGRSTGQTSRNVLRAAGWRMYDGPSLTGKAISDTVCPWCAGTTDKPAPGWRVGCHTCDWEYDPDDMAEEGELLTSEKEADQVARDHECEKWTWVKPPPMPPQPERVVVVTGSLL